MSEDNSTLDVGGKEDEVVYTGAQLLKRNVKKKRRKKSKLALYQSKQKLTQHFKCMRRRSRRRTLQMIRIHQDSSTSPYSESESEVLNDELTKTNDSLNQNVSLDTNSPRNSLHENPVFSEPMDTGNGDGLSFNEEAQDIYIKSCINQLVATNLLSLFLIKLNEHDCLTDFMKLIQMIVDGKMTVLNIPLLLLLDLARFMSCKTTTSMRYRIYTKQFWEAVYRFGGGTIIRLFSGMKNFGNVCLKRCKKSLYDPFLADVNFAVPDIKYLAQSVGVLKSKIKCGFIDEAIKMIDRSKQYNLAFDGKKISPGLSEDEGDIFLFGLEGPPNVEEQKMKLKTEVEFLSDIIRNEEQDEFVMKTRPLQLEQAVNMCTNRIKQQRMTNVKQEMLKHTFEKSMKKDVTTVFKYTNAIASIEMSQILSFDLVQKMLQQNKNLCGVMAMMRGNYEYFEDSNHVNLEMQGNTMTLFPPHKLMMRPNDELLPQYTKQGSKEWENLRKESLLTASTAYAGLGFDTHKKQKAIFNERVLGHTPPPITPEMQRKFDHGKSNEIHAFGTLAATVLPAYFSRDKVLTEIGSLYLDGDERRKMVVVSPDGFITDGTKFPDRTRNTGLTDDMSVEIKSPMGENKFTTPVHYSIPMFYIPQVLLQMRVLEVRKSLYISKCKESVVVLMILFDPNLWKEMWTLTKKMFDKVSLRKMIKCAKESKHVKSLFTDFIQNNCTILCEVPASVCVDGEYGFSICEKPYRKPKVNAHRSCHSHDIKLSLIHICKELLVLIHDAYEMERKKATELLMIVLNDTDRIFEPDSFYALPIAFLLKGYSLDVNTMREVLDIVLDRMIDEGIDVVCTSFDGQWTNLAVKDKKNEPLTRIQVQKSVWKQLGSITKDNLLKKVDRWTSVSMQDLEQCSQSNFITVGQMTFGNLHVSFFPNVHGKKVLTTSCMNGDCDFNNVMTRINTPQPHIRPDLWFEDDPVDTDDKSTEEGKIIHMATNANVLSLLPDELLRNNNIEAAIENASQMWDEDSDWLPDIPTWEAIAQSDNGTLLAEGDEIGHQLVNVNRTFLEEVLVGLCSERRSNMWTSMEVCDLYNNFLRNQKQIEKLTSYEMDVVDNVVFSYKKKHLFLKNDLKAHKVKILCRLFGRSRLANIQPIRNTKRITLKKLCKDTIKDIEFPAKVIAVAIANPMHTEAKRRWMQNATVPMRLGLPQSNTIHECYCYPEMDSKRNKLECKMLDATHILTNIRTHICTRGYKNIKREAFMRVSETDNNVLNRAYIVNILDKQCASIAMKFFSIDVQRILMMNNDTEESDFVGLVRGWYEAVDERGIPVVTRLANMQSMFEYLCNMTNFDQYPPPTKYVGGIPIVTYESLLHNISTRMQLYAICKGNCYNPRSFSTLDIETEFSNISRMEGSYNGCPKSTSLGLMILRMVQMQQLQYDQNKVFSIHVSQKKKYPENDLLSSDDETTTDDTSNESDYNSAHIRNGAVPIQFTTHRFDRRFRRQHVKKRRNVEVTTGNKPLRRESGVRVNFKPYESKIKSTTRHGLRK